MSELICDVCRKNTALGVCCVPGVPISAAYCQECLNADAHPLGIVVANTACIDGLENAAPWWKELVQHTLTYLKVQPEDFDRQVKEAIHEMNTLGEGN